LQAYSLTTDYNDSLTKEETRNQLNAFDRKYETAKKDSEIATKEIQIKKQKLQLQRGIIWAIIAAGIVLYLFWNAHKKRLLLKKEAEVKAQQVELQTMRQVLDGQEKERLRVSREIHDDLGATVTEIILLGAILDKKANSNTLPELVQLKTATETLVKNTNEIIWSLNTNNDNLISLVAWIRKFASSFLETAKIPLQFICPQYIPPISINGHTRHNVYLTVKEALNNVVKHAHATNTIIDIQIGKQIIIFIKDNGQGFLNAATNGNGLTNMKKRMEDCGGNIDVVNTNGTQIKLVFNPQGIII
jgi:signal transduction histidine kinase